MHVPGAALRFADLDPSVRRDVVYLEGLHGPELRILYRPPQHDPKVAAYASRGEFTRHLSAD
jgi:hypothetical protein